MAARTKKRTFVVQKGKSTPKAKRLDDVLKNAIVEIEQDPKTRDLIMWFNEKLTVSGYADMLSVIVMSALGLDYLDDKSAMEKGVMAIPLAPGYALVTTYNLSGYMLLPHKNKRPQPKKKKARK